MNARRVALVTCAELPEPDPDEELLLGALRAAGCAAELLAWDDEAADPGAFALCVLRSTWNYHLDPAGFARFLARAAACTRLCNDAGTVRANMHKRYLLELAERGLPTVPTVVGTRGQRMDLGAVCRAHGWGRIVVKPAISAGSYRTRAFGDDQSAAAQAFLDQLLADCDALVQPYMDSIHSHGERALVWIDGTWTHAVHKHPRFCEDDERVSDAIPIEPAERDLAERTLAAAVAGAPLLYARLDLLRDGDGAPRISELELIEPSLFLRQSPDALDRLVRGIVRRLA
ncbi:MAG: hypothetical protein H6837_12620 [Planctomycetes bacterium]|nr:hypothetical protein [Planctomycetota bacterium]